MAGSSRIIAVPEKLHWAIPLRPLGLFPMGGLQGERGAVVPQGGSVETGLAPPHHHVVGMGTMKWVPEGGMRQSSQLAKQGRTSIGGMHEWVIHPSLGT